MYVHLKVPQSKKKKKEAEYSVFSPRAIEQSSEILYLGQP